MTNLGSWWRLIFELSRADLISSDHNASKKLKSHDDVELPIKHVPSSPPFIDFIGVTIGTVPSLANSAWSPHTKHEQRRKKLQPVLRDATKYAAL